jgi:multidrug efflux pump subunit AcrA (membrane-fusion protein)
VEDAGKALAACQDAELGGQRLQLSYARDRFAEQAQPQARLLPPEAAAEAALAYAGWAPKEFGGGAGGGTGEGGGDGDDPLAAWERRQAAEAEEGQIAGELHQEQAQQAQQAHAAALEQQRAAAEAAGFQYDAASGYLLHLDSGHYYDANTGAAGWLQAPLLAACLLLRRAALSIPFQSTFLWCAELPRCML